MNWRINLSILFFFLLFSCGKKAGQELGEESQVLEYHSTKYLIEAEALLDSNRNSIVKFIDFRPEKNYQEGHITGAINIWRPDIEDDSYSFGGMMAGKEKIEQLFSRLGIENADQLIVYDDRGGCDAARFWWVLQKNNFQNLQLLNGGQDAWKKNGGAVDRYSPPIKTTDFLLPSANQNVLSITKEEILEKIESGEKITILDVRTSEEFSGMTMKAGAYKAGRIPGSVHINWTEAINMEDCKKVSSYSDLMETYNELNLKRDDLVVVYCHSGVRSAHTTFVLTELLGYRNVKNYDGSWTEWSYYDDLPLIKDPAPGTSTSSRMK